MSLVLIVVAVETEQFPIATVWRVIVMVVVFVMDRQLTQLLTVKLPPAVSTDPGKHFQCPFPVGLLQSCLGVPCHECLGKNWGVLLSDSAAKFFQDSVIRAERKAKRIPGSQA